jgi:hypothetical protein
MNTTNKSKRVLHFALLIAAATLIHQEPLIAGRHYVGFSSNPGGTTYAGDNTGLTAALSAAGASDTVYIAKGLTFYLDAELKVDEYIIGGCDPSGDGSFPTRTSIGSAYSITSNMTVLDGNSLRRTLRSDKHRVATINTGGCIENCLIRNGHASGATNTTTDKLGHGGGVLLNGGKIYNCIIRGNVAMNVQYKSSNPSKGGGIYIVSGEAVNCIVAFNMDDNGAGIDGGNKLHRSP